MFRAICAFYPEKPTKLEARKLVVVGSQQMFQDAFIDEEDNSKVLDIILTFLITDKCRVGKSV
jgi:hypothetical protein